MGQFGYCPLRRDDCVGNYCQWWNNGCAIISIAEILAEVTDEIAEGGLA